MTRSERTGEVVVREREEEVPRSILERPDVGTSLDALLEDQGGELTAVVVVAKQRRTLSLRVPWELTTPPLHGRLPFGNQAVDLVVLDEPRALVSPVGLVALVREAWRVTGRTCVLVSADRDPMEDARFELAVRDAIPGPLELQRVSGGSMLIARREAEPASRSESQHFDRRLLAAETLAARLRGELNKTEKERDVAMLRLSALEASLPHRLSDSSLARRLVVDPMQKAGNRLTKLRQSMRARGLSWPASFTDDVGALSRETELPFAGLATRARPNDPDDFVRARPTTVALCHPHWRGIRAATLDQVKHVVEVPGFESRSHALRLAGFLRDAGAERVVMNGYPPGTEVFADALAEAAPRIRFSIVYHGTPALSYGEDVVLQSMLELYQQGKLFKLGFVKHGLAEYFRFRGARAEWVMNRCSMAAQPPTPVVDGRVNIGIFAPTASHKNVETQIVAALLVPGAEVHTIEPVKAAYLQAESHRIHVHGMRPRPEFLELLRTMQAATYVSLVECYPMTVLESIFSGVICVTSNTSVLFDDVPVLHDALVVAHHDSPAAISAKLSAALERRDVLIPLAQAHLQELNVRAEQRWNEFLEN